jgi:hypothetical protein
MVVGASDAPSIFLGAARLVLVIGSLGFGHSCIIRERAHE